MLDSIPKALYVIGLIRGSATRAVHTVRSKQNRVADDRETALDKLLMSFSSLGLTVIPLIYLLAHFDWHVVFCCPGIRRWVTLGQG